MLLMAFLISPSVVNASQEEAFFAGGCFWCLEHDLEELPGIISVESGYTGGTLEKPTYQDHLGHQEAVKVVYNSGRINYATLLRSYWRNIDPFDDNGQFCDRGDSYRPVIFFKDESQEMDAIESAQKASTELMESLSSMKVEIKTAMKFWRAENYHQNFAERNNFKYNFYRYSCRRDARLDQVWGANARSSNKWE